MLGGLGVLIGVEKLWGVSWWGVFVEKLGFLWTTWWVKVFGKNPVSDEVRRTWWMTVFGKKSVSGEAFAILFVLLSLWVSARQLPFIPKSLAWRQSNLSPLMAASAP